MGDTSGEAQNQSHLEALRPGTDSALYTVAWELLSKETAGPKAAYRYCWRTLLTPFALMARQILITKIKIPVDLFGRSQCACGKPVAFSFISGEGQGGTYHVGTAILSAAR